MLSTAKWGLEYKVQKLGMNMKQRGAKHLQCKAWHMVSSQEMLTVCYYYIDSIIIYN